MIEKLKELFATLEENTELYNEKKKYKVYHAIRKTLQSIKAEAQEMRKKILDDFKKDK